MREQTTNPRPAIEPDGPPEAAQLQARHFARVADSYVQARRGSPANRQFWDYWTQHMFALIPLAAGRSTFLDPMCGSGEILEEAVKRFDRVIGADISPHMLAWVPEAVRRGSLLAVSDVCRLPLASKSVDVAMIRGGLHHVYARCEEGVREIHRVLRPGGFCVFAEPTDDNPLIRGARRIMYKFCGDFGPGEIPFRAGHLKAVLERAGLQVLDVRRFGYLGYALIGNTDILPILRRLRWQGIIDGLIRLDERSPSVPVWRTFNFVAIIVARRRS